MLEGMSIVPLKGDLFGVHSRTGAAFGMGEVRIGRLDPEGEIRIPKGSTNVHYEGELVLMIGKQARNISESQAREVIFGITCGNDEDRASDIAPARCSRLARY
jgi:hypothetical protein